MPAKLPSQEEAFAFIAGTHDVDRIPCSYGAVFATYQGRSKNSYADGHLKALQYIFTRLIDKPDFPTKDARTLTNSFKSNLALNWLRELHYTMLAPVVSDPLLLNPDRQNLETNSNLPNRNELGTYRQRQAANSYSLAPAPAFIPKILHNWLLDITVLHNEVKSKLDTAFGITKETAHKLEQTTYNSLLLLSTCQPFACCNNRLGRLVENALRLQWHLPWKITRQGQDYDQFTQDLVEYQQSQLPKVIRRAQDIRF